MKMKNIVFLTLLVGIIILFFVGIYTIGDPEDPYCTVDNGRGDMSQSIERLYVQPIERHLRIDTVTSVIVWRDMVLGEYCHGLLPFSSGRLVVSDSNLISVYAEIAMDKLSIVHPPKHTGLKIRDYLLSPDSWDAKLYPKAYFELSDIPAIGLPLGDLNTIQGKLTMCGITQRVTIPIEAISMAEMAPALSVARCFVSEVKTGRAQLTQALSLNQTMPKIPMMVLKSALRSEPNEGKSPPI